MRSDFKKVLMTSIPSDRILARRAEKDHSSAVAGNQTHGLEGGQHGVKLCYRAVCKINIMYLYYLGQGKATFRA